MAQENKMHLLNDPLHGIYIPVGLFIGGVSVLTASTGHNLFIYALPPLLLVIALRAISAYQRRRSVSADSWTDLELMDQTLISRNSCIYRFKMKNSFETLNIPTGHHLSVKVNIDGKDEIRYYTPISSKFDQGFFDILVKSYVDGTVSKYFASLKAGQTVAFKGPVGRFDYVTNGTKEIAMVCGGSGITPMLQVMNQIITTPEDTTKMTLIYANDTANDILLRDEIDELAEKYPYLNIHYVLKEAPANWSGETGLVTKEILKKYLPSVEDSRVLICGPQEFNKQMLEFTEELGFPKGQLKSKGDEQVFVF